MWQCRRMVVICGRESSSASGARGFARAGVFATDTLVASTAQEGLVRIKKLHVGENGP